MMLMLGMGVTLRYIIEGRVGAGGGGGGERLLVTSYLGTEDKRRLIGYWLERPTNTYGIVDYRRKTQSFPPHIHILKKKVGRILFGKRKSTP